MNKLSNYPFNCPYYTVIILILLIPFPLGIESIPLNLLALWMHWNASASELNYTKDILKNTKEKSGILAHLDLLVNMVSKGALGRQKCSRNFPTENKMYLAIPRSLYEVAILMMEGMTGYSSNSE